MRDAPEERVLVLLLFMQQHGGVTAREIGTTLNLPKTEMDAVLAQLVTKGLAARQIRLFSRRKVYTLSSKGVQLLKDAESRVEAILGETERQEKIA